MKNIALYTMGRTASTWLADYIIANFEQNSIPINCLWEYWGEDRIYNDPDGYVEPDQAYNWDWAIENIDQTELFNYKRSLLEKYTTVTHMYRQTEHAGYSDMPFDYMLTAPTQIVCMTRQDKFDQMLSTLIAKETGMWHAWSSEDLAKYQEYFASNKIEIELNTVKVWCNVHLVFNQRRKRLLESGSLIGNITYELLHEQAPILVKHMLKDRGVDKPTVIQPHSLSNSTKKLAPSDFKKNIVKNYDQLHHWFHANNWHTTLK